jgi:hypothetical protein
MHVHLSCFTYPTTFHTFFHLMRISSIFGLVFFTIQSNNQKHTIYFDNHWTKLSRIIWWWIIFRLRAWWSSCSRKHDNPNYVQLSWKLHSNVVIISDWCCVFKIVRSWSIIKYYWAFKKSFSFFNFFFQNTVQTHFWAFKKPISEVAPKTKIVPNKILYTFALRCNSKIQLDFELQIKTSFSFK